MRSAVSKHLMIPGGGALLAALMTVAPAYATGHRVTAASAQPVINMADQSVVPGAGGVLTRTGGGVFATLHTSGLEPGTVVTAWFGIFDRPQFCATRPCTPADFPNPAVQGSVLNMGGRIIGADGTATFGAFRAVGDASAAGGPPGTPNLGLTRPRTAEIHLVTRTHGVALEDPAALAEQLGTFNGGCPPNACANIQASIHRP